METESRITSNTVPPPFPEIAPSPIEKIEALLREYVEPLGEARAVIDRLATNLAPDPDQVREDLEAKVADLTAIIEAADELVEDAGLAVDEAVAALGGLKLKDDNGLLTALTKADDALIALSRKLADV